MTGENDKLSAACSNDGIISICGWCKESLPKKYKRVGRLKRWCSKSCRQTAFRFRRLNSKYRCADMRPLNLAYADPPYPGLARKYYRKESTYAGEVDHKKLIKSLLAFDGWALSTSRHALRAVLCYLPNDVFICPWIKTHRQFKSYGPSNIHEYLIVKPARRLLNGPPDALYASAARGGGKLKGRKPIKFVSWLFALLGAMPQDNLTDLFPGSNIVGKCWLQFSKRR